MARTEAPLKTQEFAATLYRTYNVSTAAAQTVEAKACAEKTAKDAAADFFATHAISAPKIASLFQKAARLDPSELADATQRKQFVAHLQKAIPEARAWTPPVCPVGQLPLQGPTALEIETARIAPVLPTYSGEMYVALNRAICNACRQNPDDGTVKIEKLFRKLPQFPGNGLGEFYVPSTAEAQSFDLEELVSADPDEGGETLDIIRELKHWLLNCGASEVSITARGRPLASSDASTDDAPPDGMTEISIDDFDIALQAPPRDKLVLLPLQMATQRLKLHLDEF